MIFTVDIQKSMIMIESRKIKKINNNDRDSLSYKLNNKRNFQHVELKIAHRTEPLHQLPKFYMTPKH